ncbi:MAG: type II toxin-antitoxin system Phd/YefM family antitoxin, partial [Chloroflexota bacterium]
GDRSMERRLGITEARKQLAHIVDRVKYEGENYVIVRHGQPAAVVVPMEVYRRWKEEREEMFGTIRKIQAANPNADPDQVMQDVLEAQSSLRRSLIE